MTDEYGGQPAADDDERDTIDLSGTGTAADTTGHDTTDHDTTSAAPTRRPRTALASIDLFSLGVGIVFLGISLTALIGGRDGLTGSGAWLTPTLLLVLGAMALVGSVHRPGGRVDDAHQGGLGGNAGGTPRG